MPILLRKSSFAFLIVGSRLSLCLFGRYYDFHASDEKENQGDTNDASDEKKNQGDTNDTHCVATYDLSNMLLQECHLIGSLGPC